MMESVRLAVAVRRRRPKGKTFLTWSDWQRTLVTAALMLTLAIGASLTGGIAHNVFIGAVVAASAWLLVEYVAGWERWYRRIEANGRCYECGQERPR